MHSTLGAQGEETACSYLKRQGYQILARNFRTRRGEIDIIAAQGEWLVFVEVKTRKSLRCGLGAEAVTWRKRQHLLAAALSYLATHSSQKCRFDVVEITIPAEKAPEIRHIQDAFGRN